MPVTHIKLATARDFLNEVVVKDVEDFSAESESLRKAFHCALSLYHLHEWVFASHSSELTHKSVRDFDKSLCASSVDFQLIRDIANAAKHMELTRDPQRITHAANTAVQSTGWGEGGYGMGPYGGGPRVRIHVGPTEFEEFSVVSQSVLDMWRTIFTQHGW